jgi:hypothetical protein
MAAYLKKYYITSVLWVLMLGVLAYQSACVGAGYSQDPRVAQIQALTDFCVGYGVLRDAATNFIVVDTARNDPVLTADMVLGYQGAKDFISPFCSPDFDPTTQVFDLDNLDKELLKIRLILLQKENEGL